MRSDLRDLPWRHSRDPWEVFVAECMLQQTQVARVIPKWHAFLERFPDTAACSEASVGEVIKLWEGLGYNRRAVQLHRCAVDVTELHRGSFPNDLPALLRLPGVGPYTARAILAFAFERDVAVLDTNVARIVARCVTGRTLSLNEAQATADSLVPAGEGWLWNQGMLDLGAVVCTKRSPNCMVCPVRACCAWRETGDPASDPAVGSAAVAVRQSRFDGSDRQIRGRVVDALRRGPLTFATVELMSQDLDPERVGKILRSLIKDGLAVDTPHGYVLAR
jgi:A/G-specific adenine glycosylase